jgi:hypothetical protein
MEQRYELVLPVLPCEIFRGLVVVVLRSYVCAVLQQ